MQLPQDISLSTVLRIGIGRCTPSHRSVAPTLRELLVIVCLSAAKVAQPLAAARGGGGGASGPSTLRRQRRRAQTRQAQSAAPARGRYGSRGRAAGMAQQHSWAAAEQRVCGFAQVGAEEKGRSNLEGQAQKQ